MKVVRTISIALALVVTAMVAPSRADMIYSLQAYDVEDSSGNDISVDGVSYSITNSGATVSFSGTALPAGGAYVDMNVFADVLDANDLYAHWNTTYGNATTNITTTPTHTYNFAAVGNYNPSPFYTLTGSYKTGTKTSYSNPVLAVPTLQPYLTVGVNSAAMSIINSGGPTALSGTVASTTPTGGGVDSAFNPLTSSPGVAFQAAQAGGVNLGPGTIGMSSSDYFIANYGPTGVTNPSSSAFSYLTGSLDNPDNFAGVAFSQVQIGGKWYSQIFLGTISFAVTGVTGAQQTATITPQNMTTAAGNATFWMEDGALFTSANGTFNYQSVSVTVSGNSVSGGSLSLSGPVGVPRIMVNGTTPLTFTLSNPGSDPLSNWNLTATAANGGLSALSPSSGTLAASGGTATSTTTYTAPGTPGIDTITGTATSTDNGGLSAISSGTIDVVKNRPLTVNSTVPLAAANQGLLLGGTWNVTVSGPGSDTLNTNPSMTASSFTTVTGGVTAVGSTGTFTASASNQNVTMTFATSGTTPAITGSDLVSHGLIIPEGIGDTVTITGTAVPAGTIVGTATASNGGAHAYNNTFNGTVLESQVAAGQAYAGLSSTVTGVSGGPNNMLGTVATILAGTNNSGSPTTAAMTWRTRATDETAGTIQQPPMSYANKAGYLTSDVVNVTGIATSASSPYVLQMSFDPSLLASGAQDNFSNGWLYLGSLSGSGTGETWGNAVWGDTGVGSEAKVAQGEDWNTFINNNGGVGNLANLLGSWGVDTTNNVAWAVIDYNGTFAVVPEPGTLVLLLVAAGILTPVIRRRWRAWKKN